MEIRRCGADPIDFELLFFKGNISTFLLLGKRKIWIFPFLARGIKNIKV